MEKYYLAGYTPPAGVTSASAVKEYQQRLGVAMDGIWGPKTQAAYEQYLAGQQSASSKGYNWDAPATGTDLFNTYYQTILKQISVPTVTVDTPSAETVKDQWQSILKPSVDAAISRRESASQRAQAELDADAVSRGMGSSSYVSSVKSRESQDAAGDIQEMEAQYGATLAERIAATLQSYDQMRLSAQQYNLQAQQAAQQAALNLAGDWYRNYVSEQNALSKASVKSVSTSSGSNAASNTRVSSNLTTSDYIAYVENLSDSQRRQLFSSSQSYWKVRRDELLAALGSSSYLSLRERYIGK